MKQKSGSPVMLALGAVAVMFLSSGTGGAADQAPPLTVGGVTTEGLVISTTSASITRSIPIINTQKSVVAVTIEAPDLIGPDSASIKTTWELDGQSKPPLTTAIKPLATAQLTLTTTLHAAGLYQGTISLIYGNKRYPVALKITRASSQPSVMVTGLDAVAFQEEPAGTRVYPTCVGGPASVVT